MYAIRENLESCHWVWENNYYNIYTLYRENKLINEIQYV